LPFGGEGVGRVDDFVVFVPFVITGETVEPKSPRSKKTLRGQNCCASSRHRRTASRRNAATSARAAAASISTWITRRNCA
jgi:tRNA/tmRNA/rRNA uracil-C5-methylase (TrmA/RlmC/RlmD family)